MQGMAKGVLGTKKGATLPRVTGTARGKRECGVGQTGAGEADEARSQTGQTRSWNRKKKSLQRSVSPSFILSFINAFFLSKCSCDLFLWKQPRQNSVEENNPHFVHVGGACGLGTQKGRSRDISALSSGRADTAGAGGGTCKLASASRARHLACVAEGSSSGSVDQNACLGGSNMASPGL